MVSVYAQLKKMFSGFLWASLKKKNLHGFSTVVRISIIVQVCAHMEGISAFLSMYYTGLNITAHTKDN